MVPDRGQHSDQGRARWRSQCPILWEHGTWKPRGHRACLPKRSLIQIPAPGSCTSQDTWEPSHPPANPLLCEVSSLFCTAATTTYKGLILVKHSHSVTCWVPGLLVNPYLNTPCQLRGFSLTLRLPIDAQQAGAITFTVRCMQAGRVKSPTEPLAHLLFPHPTGMTHPQGR